MAIAVGKTIFSEDYALASLLAFVYFSVSLGMGSKAFEARFRSE
tara:strand:- start:449 stop:580 length:132 start_codon:yes stop_codon:yes gene_type:complete